MTGFGKWVGAALPRYEMSVIRSAVGKRGESILDMGCGQGNVAGKIIVGGYSVGADAFLPYLRIARARGVHTDYVLCDVRHLPFRERSFDSVMCLDVIEHIEKPEGLAAIAAAENIARWTVVLSTPTGWHEQHEYDGDAHQEHRSAWLPSDFARLGYKVRGISLYPKLLDKAGSSRRLRRVATFGVIVIGLLLIPVAYFVPKAGGRVVAEKTIRLA